MSYAVAIVVDRDFGPGLLELASRLHVWVCSTPANRGFVEKYRTGDPDFSLERGVTAFRVEAEQSPEDMLLEVLGDVDLHHGEYSQAPAWDTLQVYGAPLTDPVRQALGEFGVTTFTPTPRGFACVRSSAGAA